MILRNVVALTPSGRVEGDVRLEDGRIAEIGRVGGADESLECDGQLLMPGAIDGHVHFREPGATHKEDWSSGSRAAVAGGVTTVLEMPNTTPTTTSLQALEDKRALANAKTVCNYGLFFGATPYNLDDAQRVENVCALKIFMGCSTGDLLVYQREDLEPIFAGYPGLIGVHAEAEERLRERSAAFADRDDVAVHSEIRDVESARLAVALACDLAREHRRRLHVLHLSTRAELNEIAKANHAGAAVSCEVAPHHWLLDVSAYAEQGTFVRMNPPLRDESDRVAMWDGLLQGDIAMVATDHAPHVVSEKERPYREAPSGVPGVETVLPLLLDAAHRGACTYEQVVRWLCEAPCEIYGIGERGRIEVGAHADLVLVATGLTREVRNEDQWSRCAWTPWHGRSLTGWPTATFVGGRLAFRRAGDSRGEVVAEAGSGTEVLFTQR